ncbi:hypothetical protein SAMN05444280_11050 [Tangfeifania diversioriginum]|uniref:Uncharacterized protein n=1 Tax=Tangfeifania diversioriginum TaxID=1168035 RepID=A0A1M6G6J7_9BACT|nr:hypothetical protein [Tangfeifania diversioriginum]SHJ05539.1 hypothetical protein SAMN05444280_11050 [Tangfeifania diversioriginum]
MKRKVNKKNFNEVDNFDRKVKKKSLKREKSSKKRLSIYDEFDDEDLDDYSYSKPYDFDDDEDEEDFND